MQPSSPGPARRKCEVCGAACRAKYRHCSACRLKCAGCGATRQPKHQLCALCRRNRLRDRKRGWSREKARAYAREARTAPGIGPLADARWRRAALGAIETWERYGSDMWTRDQWISDFRRSEVVVREESQIRAFEREILRWREIGIEVLAEFPPYSQRGRQSETSRYYFTPAGVDRLILIREMLDRYLIVMEEPCSSTTAQPDSESAPCASATSPATVGGAGVDGAERGSETSDELSEGESSTASP